MYKGYNHGVEDGVKGTLKIIARELTLMEKKSKGMLLHKTQVEFFHHWLKAPENIKAFVKEVQSEEH